MSDAIHNERIKLGANALDRLSSACFVVGIFAPLATRFQAQNQILVIAQLVIFAGWFLGGVVLHIVARHILGRMRHDN